MDIRTKRIYDDPEPGDGTRVLVDRLWPRGVSKEDAGLDMWVKEVAPSSSLRSWFDHDVERWAEFRTRYRAELDDGTAHIETLCDVAGDGTVTLLYAAADGEHNNAVALADYLGEECS